MRNEGHVIQKGKISEIWSPTSLVKQRDFCTGTSCFPSKPKETGTVVIHDGFNKQRKKKNKNTNLSFDLLYHTITFGA